MAALNGYAKFQVLTLAQKALLCIPFLAIVSSLNWHP